MTTAPQRYAGQRALVFGASGFIGRWVARALQAEGATLELVARDVPAARRVAHAYGFAGEFHDMDLDDIEKAAALTTRLEPDVVFNLAGYGIDRTERDPEPAARINTELPEALARSLVALTASKRTLDPSSGPRLVHVGSALEYGELTNDLSEDSLPEPTTLYGKTKLAGSLAVQRLCAEAGVHGVTARLFTVFGPGEHPGRLFPTLTESATQDGPIPLTAGRQKRDFCFVEDVAEGLLRLGLADLNPGEIVNLACGQLHTVHNFVELAAETMGIDPQRLDFGAIPTRGEEMDHEPVSIKRLRERTAWSPTDNLGANLRRAHGYTLV
jgi:nucleoside-diphosphate-sugar epimerase